MIKNKNIKVYISYRNITHYRKLGYDPILNDYLEILTSHLPSSSHVRIISICEICNKESDIIYHKYIMNKKRHGYYGCKSCSRQKASLTSISKWGVDNYGKTEESKKRHEKTNLEKYGYKTNLISPIYKEMIENILIDKYGTKNHWEIRRKRKKFELNEIIYEIKDQPIDLSEDSYKIDYIKEKFRHYKNECRRLTKRNSKILYENWDGIDFYDGELIKPYLLYSHRSRLYPTIDHKISLHWGFMNGISPEDISDISNLCITKRYINSKKRDTEFNQ